MLIEHWPGLTETSYLNEETSTGTWLVSLPLVYRRRIVHPIHDDDGYEAQKASVAVISAVRATGDNNYSGRLSKVKQYVMVRLSSPLRCAPLL